MGYSILLTRCGLLACCSKKKGRSSVCVYLFWLVYMLCVMQFFEMQRDDAIKALGIYKRAINQVNHDITFAVS
jgi:hypothetical protein